MESYQTLMEQAILLAEQGRGFVEPNPMVGCLIWKNGKVIGKGFHEKFGESHAEVNALQSCEESPENATAIVSLEPCCHQGKTPPCTDALIHAGISKVVVGLRDPCSLVDGGGIAALRNSGIEVITGVLSLQVAIQNAGFVKRHLTGKPWVIAKYAMTFDGNISTLEGDSKWISNEASRNEVHRWRSCVDGIIVGAETVKMDDPQLTARHTGQLVAGPRKPLRIVLNGDASIGLDSSLVKTAGDVPCLLVVDPDRVSEQRLNEFRNSSVEILPLEQKYGERIKVLLEHLGQRGMTNLIVEGGSGVLGEFLASDELDEVHVYLAPKLLGAGRQPFALPQLSKISEAKKFEILQVKQLEDNIFVRGLINQQVLEFP